MLYSVRYSNTVRNSSCCRGLRVHRQQQLLLNTLVYDEQSVNDGRASPSLDLMKSGIEACTNHELINIKEQGRRTADLPN